MSQMILLLRNNPGLGPNKKSKEIISKIQHQHLGFQCMLHLLAGKQLFSLQEKNRNSNLAKPPICPSDISLLLMGK